MPSFASSLYSGRHLTNEARRRLARLYFEAEQDDSLLAKIARKTKPKPGEVLKQSDSKTHNTEQDRPSPKIVSKSMETNVLSYVDSDTATDFDHLIAEDLIREQWGDKIRKTRHQDVALPKTKEQANWGSIIAFEQKQFEKSVQRLHKTQEETKEQYRASLQEQMRLHQEHEESVQAAHQREAAEKKKNLEIYMQQNKAIAEEKTKKLEMLKESRLEQIHQREVSRRKQKKEHHEMEQRASESLKKKLEHEKVQAAILKNSNRKHQWQVICENNKERAAKKALAQEEVLKNKEVQQLYNDIKDKEELERRRVIELRHIKQQHNDAGYEQIRLQRNEQLKLEDERIARDQEHIAKLEDQRQREEAEARQIAIDRDHSVLLQQIEEKINRKAAMKKVEMEYKDKLVIMANIDREKREKLENQANLEKRRLQAELQEQMHQLEAKKLQQKIEMTPTERQLNDSILKKIAEEEN